MNVQNGLPIAIVFMVTVLILGSDLMGRNDAPAVYYYSADYHVSLYAVSETPLTDAPDGVTYDTVGRRFITVPDGWSAAIVAPSGDERLYESRGNIVPERQYGVVLLSMSPPFRISS